TVIVCAPPASGVLPEPFRVPRGGGSHRGPPRAGGAPKPAVSRGGVNGRNLACLRQAPRERRLQLTGALTTLANGSTLRVPDTPRLSSPAAFIASPSQGGSPMRLDGKGALVTGGARGIG